MLDDKDNSVRIQTLNALKAFSGIRKFRLKIQVSPGASGGQSTQDTSSSWVLPLMGIGYVITFQKFVWV